MSDLDDYLASLEGRGVRLWVDNGQLRYHANKGVLGSEDLSKLRALKSSILAELSRKSNVDTNRLEDDRPVAALTGPASFQQQWVLGLMEQYSTWLQSQSFAFFLEGELDLDRLERSLAVVVRRHSSLRSRISKIGREYRQNIEDSSRWRLQVVYVPNELGGDYIPDFVRRGQDLSVSETDAATGRVLRAAVLRVSAAEHYLVLSVHRAAADCMAIGQVFRELWLEYEVASQDSGFSATADYLDYALRQRENDETWQAKHGAYWEKQLIGARPVQWPNHTTTVARGAPRNLLECSLGLDLSARLRATSRETKCLSALVMLSVCASVISQWCDQRDFVMPFNVAGRHAGHDGIVGLFSHVLFLRVNLNPDEPFADVLGKVSGDFYKAICHQDFGRMAHRHPELLKGLFCQWLSWHPAEIASREMYDLPRRFGIIARPLRFQTAEHLSSVPVEVTDLDVCFFEKEEDIGVVLVYRTDVFATETLERFVDALRSRIQRLANG